MATCNECQGFLFAIWNFGSELLILLITREDPGGGDMQFWKKDKDGEKGKEKINYKSRLEHKQYLVNISQRNKHPSQTCFSKI